MTPILGWQFMLRVTANHKLEFQMPCENVISEKFEWSQFMHDSLF
jgi:hypothetical protein